MWYGKDSGAGSSILWITIQQAWGCSVQGNQETNAECLAFNFIMPDSEGYSLIGCNRFSAPFFFWDFVTSRIAYDELLV